MFYQTINPFTEEVVKTFKEHTDAKLSGYGRKLAQLGIGEFVNKKLIRVA